MIFKKSVVKIILMPVFGTIIFFTTPAAAQVTSVNGTLRCTVVNNTTHSTGTTTNPIPFVSVNIRNAVCSNPADVSGNFSCTFPTPFNSANVHLTLTYSGTVTTAAAPPAIPAAVSTSLQLMDYVFIAHTDGLDASGTVHGTVLELGNVTVATDDCEVWRIGALVLDDYHRVDLRSPPTNRLRIMRPYGVITGTAYTFYDYVRVRFDYLTATDNAYARTDTIFQEFAHTVRHVFDSPDNINHWNCDDFRWAYGRNHCGNEISNMHYAFNEGWAAYWAAVRHRGSARENLVDNCGFAPDLIGNENWVEGYVANSLMDIEDQLVTTNGLTREQAQRQMLDTLRRNPRTIHSLYAFKKSLAALVGWAAPPEPAKCPKDYTNDGLTCRKDVVTQSKPSYGRGAGTVPKSCASGEQLDTGLCYPLCRTEYHGAGPMCWGNCPEGFHDDGMTCRKDVVIQSKPSYGRGAGTVPKNCDAGKENDAGLCYPVCRAGYHGVGPVCWESCPSGYHDDGATCRRDARIISANNSSCPWYDKCGLTLKKGCSTCPAGYHNDGCTCRIDANIYGKKSYGRGAGTVPKNCGTGKEYDAGLCYPSCRTGYHGVGPVCWGNCPSGYHDDGATCRKDAVIQSKPSYGRGVGKAPKNCAPGKEYDAGLCYNRCRNDFHGVGPVCWGQCPLGFEDHGATCYIGTNVIIRGGSCNFEAWTWY
jgi:hypothetical protein